jgi:methionyl-tRNA formyltransferase
VIFLGTEDSPIRAWADDDPSIAVLHGHRQILTVDEIEKFALCINVHISLLPYNRGADPNLWSHLDGTPAGVTIHVVDAGVDTGPIIAQRRVTFPSDATLATSYAQLQETAVALFAETWPAIKAGTYVSTPQPAGGTSHRSADRARVMHLLHKGWDTPIADLAKARAELALGRALFKL